MRRAPTSSTRVTSPTNTVLHVKSQGLMVNVRTADEMHDVLQYIATKAGLVRG
jgi:hypothetical protein